MNVLLIAKTDALIRLRRLSTVVIFLLLSAFAYVWIPDPATGRALIRVGTQRALYNSAAIGMGTAILGAFFVGLFGFYVVSNAIRRDAQTRCGAVLAATTMGNGEYIVGKFLGNILFLSLFLLGFMLVSMAMVVVRGEAPLEPMIFLGHYLLIAPPPIVFVSAVAVLFESVPLLSGRFGDVAYFFLFMAAMGFSVAALINGFGWAGMLDPSGLTGVIAANRDVLHTTEMSIGAGPFDPRLPPVVYPGLPLRGWFVAQRIVALFVPLPLLLLARASFHRFDPVRVKVAAKGEKRWLARLNRALKPLTRWMSGGGLVTADAAMTLTSAPLIAVAIVAAAFAPPSIAFAAMALSIADIACRDQRDGTTSLIRSAPRVRERFVLWKTASASMIAAAFLAVPALRAGLRGMLPLAGGAIFVVAAATALGVISGNAKAFIVLFLSFWYVVINDRGATPALDFAGFYGKAGAAVTAAYALIAAGLLAAAQLIYALRLRRD